MSMRAVAALQSGFLVVAMSMSATSTKTQMQITVLDSVTRASTPDNNNGVPQNCEQLTFDAYCRSTTNVPLTSTLLVQEGDLPPFHISCRIDSRYSRCIPLPKGETFDARREKHGITVYYVDDKGKPQRQLYSLVAGETIPRTAATTLPQNVPAAKSPAAATTPAAAPIPAASGAEITVDGKFVGSTPSEIEIGAGTHAVTFSMPGFSEWKRDLTVTAGSNLSVNAILQKQP
jgi:hypothetical protein